MCVGQGRPLLIRKRAHVIVFSRFHVAVCPLLALPFCLCPLSRMGPLIVFLLFDPWPYLDTLL